MLKRREKRYRRHRRVRAKIYGTATRPRLSVFRSAKHIYAQLIDDEKGQTLAAVSDLELKLRTNKSLVRGKQETKPEKTKKQLTGKAAIAYEAGKLIAEKANKKRIKKVVFDRGGHKYHGRMRALAEGAREGGLKF